MLELISNNEKAKELLGWKPEIEFSVGLEKTIEFVSTNIDLFKTDSYNI